MKYSTEWKQIVTRLGRWIDMENNYKTMDANFMESVWNIFQQLWKKDLVYRGIKVLPYSTGCTTVLSNFEAGMNYKEVPDPEVYVNFQSADDPNVNYIAWTTTPWTLPSNLALCVNPALTYVKVEDNATKVQYIFLKDRIATLYPVSKKKKGAAPLPYTILEEFPGKNLEGKKYVPLFPYFSDFENAFQIITASYVKSDSGTGIVHQAPAFGEEDYKATVKAGIIKKGGDVPCPVDESGRFTSKVTLFAGQYVKDADKEIIKYLKDNGRLFRSGTIVHSYPFCWRSEQPLIYKAVPCWFVKVEEARDKLMANNLKTYWVPEFVQTKRFHNWLSDANDWAVSRSRYWGTPLPVWVSDDYEEMVAVGSIDELEELSGVRVTDLHRESIDHITIPSKQGKGTLRRIEDVFDCWFESGSMPYAQLHYPFENKEVFDKGFPADFIAEGIDQTRGWFYTLLVISTMLFDKPPFKNLIVNGLVLAEDGKKMSKRLKNYPDPTLIVDKYGADALRMYLINSPVVRGDNLCFKEPGVHGIIRDLLLPWFNAYRFLVQSVHGYESKNQTKFVPDFQKAVSSPSMMDKWILASTQTLVKFISTEMEAYRLYTVLPRLVTFIEQLTNWYVRLNRKRFRTSSSDPLSPLNTLYEVLLTTTKAMAPFIPFFTEYIYQNLRKCLPGDSEESVHYCAFPVPRLEAINNDIEKSVGLLQSIVELGRCARERRKIAHRQPLNEILIFLKFPEDEQNLEPVMSILYDELNVKKITFPKDSSLITYLASANFNVLGKRVGKDMKAVAAKIKELKQDEIIQFRRTGTIEILGHDLTAEDINISRKFTGDVNVYEPSNDGTDLTNHPNVAIALDVLLTPELIKEGTINHLVNKVQRLRKDSGILVTDSITIYYLPSSDEVAVLVEQHKEFVMKRTERPFARVAEKPEGSVVVGTSTYTIENDLYNQHTIVLEVVKN